MRRSYPQRWRGFTWLARSRRSKRSEENRRRVGEGDMLRTQMAIIRRLAKHEPFNTIALRQKIAQRVIEMGSTWSHRSCSCSCR